MTDTRPNKWRISAYPPGERAPPDPVYKPDLDYAKNYADKAWPVGLVVIEHIETEEEHRRRRGEWTQTRLAVQPELSFGDER